MERQEYKGKKITELKEKKFREIALRLIKIRPIRHVTLYTIVRRVNYRGI